MEGKWNLDLSNKKSTSSDTEALEESDVTLAVAMMYLLGIARIIFAASIEMDFLFGLIELW